MPSPSRRTDSCYWAGLTTAVSTSGACRTGHYWRCSAPTIRLYPSHFLATLNITLLGRAKTSTEPAQIHWPWQTIYYGLTELNHAPARPWSDGMAAAACINCNSRRMLPDTPGRTWAVGPQHTR